MNKNLILTGWSKNSYLAGAATALAALNGNADIVGVSMDALAGVLAKRGPDYSAVYVLGVGLTKNIPQILAALKALKKKHVKTVWLSGIRVAPEFAAEVCIECEDPAKRGFDELLDEPCDSLVDAIARYFGTTNEEGVRFFRSYEQPVADRSSSVGKYQTLVNVSGYMHRTRGDDSIYEAAIRALYMRVKPTMWEVKLKEAFEDYNRYGRRELVDVRLVAATNKNLPKMVREGKFRADLYQRISTIVIDVPPLRDRREDIYEIASGFWLDMGWGRLTREQCDALSVYDYPGNVRELINILDRARALDEKDFAHLIEEHVRINRDLGSSDGETDLPENLNDAIRVHVKAVFARHGQNLGKTCKALGISLNTLKKYLRT